MGYLYATLHRRSWSINHLNHGNICFPLQSTSESVRKAKDGSMGRAIRGGEKPTDLLGKEVRACCDGGAVVA